MSLHLPGTCPLISVDRVTKRFPGVVALDDVSLEIAAGEFHAVVGENGAGKSTLMKILSGVITDYEGRLRLRGEPVRFSGTRDAEAAGISIIHQELNLVDELTAAGNIFLGRERCKQCGTTLRVVGPAIRRIIPRWLRLLDERAMEREAARLLAELDCDIDPAVPLRRLRVGDRQLVEIAKSLSLEAEILIMDEPTSALTETEVDRLFRVIRMLRDRGVTILYITHKMDEVFRLSDRITVLRDGRLIQTVKQSDTGPREVTHLMVGREIEEFDLGGERQPGESVLEVKHLSLPWPGHARKWRLSDVSFRLRRGEVLGIAGLMGAGRTELLECLFGAAPEPPQGEIRIDGRPVRLQHPAEARDAGIALVAEDRKRLGMFPQMTVRENITICTLPEATVGKLIWPGRERMMAEESIGRLGVRTAGVDAPITSLSGGNQQKCIIARWLRTDPKVLLLDDPTRGVDVGAKAELYKIIDALCRRGIGIIITSSELPELITLCDRILVLCEGRLTGRFERGRFTEQIIMEAATARSA